MGTNMNVLVRTSVDTQIPITDFLLPLEISDLEKILEKYKSNISSGNFYLDNITYKFFVLRDTSGKFLFELSNIAELVEIDSRRKQIKENYEIRFEESDSWENFISNKCLFYEHIIDRTNHIKHTTNNLSQKQIKNLFLMARCKCR